jgi:hypothetical protein
MSMPDGNFAEHPSEQSPWSRPVVLVSGAFLLVLVLAGILVAFTGGDQHQTQPAPAQPSISPRDVTTAAAANPGACTLTGGSRSIPSASRPAGTHWASVGSMQAPQAPDLYGPQRRSGLFDMCFAHSPAGALLAAANLWAESTAAPPNEVFQRLAVGAPRDLGSNARLDNGGSVQLAGYRYDSYSPSQAQISVVLKGPEGKLAAVVTTMTWAGGDWKYVFPPNGTPPVQVISDLTGYVPWSAF